MTPPARRFSDRPKHPWVAVDVAIYTVSRRELQCLLVQVKEGPFAGRWAFPGGLVGAEESLDQAADRELLERTGLKQSYIEQLYTFGKPERDPALRVVSASYLALAPNSRIVLKASPKYAAIRWFPADHLPHLAYEKQLGGVVHGAVGSCRGQAAGPLGGIRLHPTRSASCVRRKAVRQWRRAKRRHHRDRR